MPYFPRIACDEDPEVVGRHLVAEPAAAAVEHDDHLVGEDDAEGSRGFRVEDVFGPGDLDLQVVVPRPQGADLSVPPVDRFLAHPRGVGAAKASLLLGALQVLLPPVPALHRPPGPLFHGVAELVPGDPDGSLGAHAGGNAPGDAVHEVPQARLNLPVRQVREAEPHPAVDVESDSAGGDHAVIGDPSRRDRRWGTRTPSDRRACSRRDP